MPDQPTKQQWTDYETALNLYALDVKTYVANYNESGENPPAPLPPKPPAFSGWAGE